jgi:hypothetical protein
MSQIIEVITGRATNPAALTALTQNTGDSFTVRAFGDGVSPFLENVWTQQATAGFVRIRSPRMHDNVQNLRSVAPATLPRALYPIGMEQVLYATDTLTFEIQGGGAEVDAAAMLIRYDGVSSSMGRFATWPQIKPLIRNWLTVQVDTAGPVTSGDWSPGTNFTNLTDLLKANTFYAVLGYETDAPCLAIAMRGPDTGNFRVGGPGTTEPLETRHWFKNLSDVHGAPHIPVFNSQNKSSTQSFVSRITAAGTVNVTWTLVELSSAVG